MRIVIRPLEHPASQLQQVIVRPDTPEDRVLLKKLTTFHSEKCIGFHPDGESEVELKMQRYLNEAALVGAVQRVLGCKVTKEEFVDSAATVAPTE